MITSFFGRQRGRGKASDTSALRWFTTDSMQRHTRLALRKLFRHAISEFDNF
jgi:hypothetical protein